MALNKLRQIGQYSAGVTMPKGDLRYEGLLDQNGELDGDHYVKINHEGDGKWTIELVEEIQP
ncbi:hypothetical protein C482_14639 [Natrialba chahannaoensis JCM 10990]|uniref:DUF8053 domain-containing protein n=1 Tax=Natrialba chahannaoensis JCM 10990 TaxID=1227492 RepID=M0AGL5_9EURY|nr:hypothetical protein [Natrialba chahannaoensis]ELY97017.1 hypothetical protein C482_14639 [Natrialba chahannaoensis JCM 10990]